MSFTVIEDKREVRYRVEGEAPMIGVHGGPDAAKFLPDLAVVIFYSGVFDEIFLSGPRIAANGKPLKRDRLLTGYDRDLLFHPSTDPDMAWDLPPQWVLDLVKEACK